MLNKPGFKTITIITAAFILFQTSQAFARGNERSHDRDRNRNQRHYEPYRGHYRGYNHYPKGRIELALSNDFFSIFLGSSRFYVSDGIYYRYTPRGYQLVQPPATIVQPVQIVQVPAPAIPVKAPAVVENNSFTVNIPDAKGGYASVIIKRSGTGFTGPQEEFYPEFPKIDQLKVMYGT